MFIEEQCALHPSHGHVWPASAGVTRKHLAKGSCESLGVLGAQLDDLVLPSPTTRANPTCRNGDDGMDHHEAL